MKNTFKEYDESRDKNVKQKNKEFQDYYNDPNKNDLKFRLSKERRLQILEFIENQTDSLYFRVYAKTGILPRSLKLEWIKNEIFELNNLLHSLNGPHPIFEQDDLNGWFLEYYFFSYNSKNPDFDLSLQPPTLIGTIEEMIEYFPNYYEILDQLCLRLHQKNLIQCYEELENGGEMPTPPLKFTKSLKDTQQIYLYNQLTGNGLFLPKETNYKAFCYVFGGNVKPYDFQPLKWNKNVQLLRELLLPLKHSDISQATMEKEAGKYFVDKKGKSRPLAKDNPKPDLNSDLVKNLVKNLATL